MHAQSHDVNVSTSSIGPAQAPPLPSAGQSPPQQSDPGSFGQAMQCAQTKDGMPASPASAPQAKSSSNLTWTKGAAASTESSASNVLESVVTGKKVPPKHVPSNPQAVLFGHVSAVSTDDQGDADPLLTGAARDIPAAVLPGANNLPEQQSQQGSAPVAGSIPPNQQGSDATRSAMVPEAVAAQITDLPDAPAGKMAPGSSTRFAKTAVHAQEPGGTSATASVPLHAGKSIILHPSVPVPVAVSASVTSPASGSLQITPGAAFHADKSMAPLPGSTQAGAAAKTPAAAALGSANRASGATLDGITSQGLQIADASAASALPYPAVQGSAADDLSVAVLKDGGFPDNAQAAPFAPPAPSAQPAVVFAPSLAPLTPSVQEHRVSSGSVSAPVSPAENKALDEASSQAVPVRRLEIAVQDPVLGNVGVRAEMRSGLLHATLTGAQDSTMGGMPASIPALHQFLQQHDVNVHSLTYATARDGVAASAPTTFSGSDTGRNAAGGSFSGSAHSGSQASQDSGPQRQQRFSSTKEFDGSASAPSYRSQLPGMAPAAMANNTSATGSNLSIHI